MRVNWKAKWIWAPGLAGKPNTYVLFRRGFAWSGRAGAQVRLHATAGHFFRIYLNGKLVGRGPDRCYFREKIFHTYDVGPLLRRGRNVIAVHVHFLGERVNGLMERHAEGPAGCLVQLDVNGKPQVWTDARWRTAVDPAYACDTEAPTIHREWREEYHAARALRGWERPGFDDRAWSEAECVAPAEGGPWKRLVAKDTPELTAEATAPLNVYITHRGGPGDFEYDHYRIYNTIAKSPERIAGDFSLRNEKQERQELLFDMGRVVAGYPRIDIASCKGGKIDVYYGDSLSMSHWDTIHLGDGPLVWTPFTLRGGRFFRLEVTGARHPVVFRPMRWIRTNYPVQRRATFECSDPRLNAIWRMCALSAETCGLEHIVDCVGREQVLWMMDFRFQAPQHLYYFGDTALVRKCFRQFATLQMSNGHILGYGPSCRPKETLLSPQASRQAYDWFGFNFYFIQAVREHFESTGDRAFLREMYPVAQRALDYYIRAERDGWTRVGEVPGHPNIDWGYGGYGPAGKAVYAVLQAQYYAAMMDQSSMAALLGKSAAARALERRAARLERRFFASFIDPRTGRVADYLAGGRRRCKDTSQVHAAVLRYFDHIPAKVREACLEGLTQRTFVRSRTGFMNAQEAEALFRQGRPDAAVKLIADYWGAILDAGLPQTPEFYDAASPKGADSRWGPTYSRCHSYASLAGVLLQQKVLGAHVEGPRVRVAPWFGVLQYASGRLPHPAGDVKIEWRRGKDGIRVRVTAPPSIEVTFEPGDAGTPVTFELDHNDGKRARLESK